MILPWPARALSPNARVHWRRKAQSARVYKDVAIVVTQAERLRPPAGKIELRLTFRPPCNRRRDEPARDGIAAAMGIDDDQFVVVPVIGEVDPSGRGFVDVQMAAVEG